VWYVPPHPPEFVPQVHATQFFKGGGEGGEGGGGGDGDGGGGDGGE
tara:strand:+ start:290 stop:427 length:138 start_codon:yes stop_codon:yes gene_type:complete